MNKKAIYDLSYGMYIVGTTQENDMPTGCVVNTVFQITSSPMTVAVSINYDNFTNTCIQNKREFTISVLREDVRPLVIGGFGYRSGKDNNKFDGVEYKTVMNHMPVITEGTCGYLHCKVENIVDVGTHALFIAEVIDADKFDSDSKPMTYSYYRNVIKGESPKNAPTYSGD